MNPDPTASQISVGEMPINFLPLIEVFFVRLTSGAFDVTQIVAAIETVWYVWAVVATLFSVACLYGIVYASSRYNQLAAIEDEHLAKQEELFRQKYGTQTRNSRWDEILQHIESGNPNDWKQGIIEADIMLEDILRDHGHSGSTIGEMLKGVSPQSVLTLDDAWAAHRVRNQIAHEGADFVLTHRLARDTIKQFERVFTEFGVI